jgi:hypothetical protein
MGAALARPLAGGVLVAAAGLLAMRLPGGTLVELAVAGTLGLGSYALVVAPLRHLLRREPDAVSAELGSVADT